MKQLQIAFDTKSLDECIKIGKECEEYLDIIEFGTPLVYKYGAEGITKLKEAFPGKKILADFKIMDAGEFETKIALNAGADIVTVLAAADNQTIEDSLKAVKEVGKELLVDLICVDNFEERVTYLEKIGVDYICVHTGSDTQKLGANPLEDLIRVKKLVKNTKVSVAGGVKVDTIKSISDEGPDVIIVGGGLYNVENPGETAKQMVDIIK